VYEEIGVGKPTTLSRAEIRSEDSVLKAGTSMRRGNPGNADMYISRRYLSSESLAGVTPGNRARFGKPQCDKLRDTRDGLLELN